MNASPVSPTSFPVRWTAHLPGLLLTAAVAVIALVLGTLPAFQAHGLGALTLAIVLGIALGNTVYPRWSARASAGAGSARHWLLRAGIVLYGLRLTFQDIGQVGVAGWVIDAVMVASTLGLAAWVGTRRFGLARSSALLIGAGSAICGAAAVMAAQPVVRGKAEEVTVAVSTVVVFGTLAMFAYPLLYPLLVQAGVPLDDHLYGVFTGSTVHEVAQVVVAANAVSADAADTAVITKMVRVMLLAPTLVGLSLLLVRGAPQDAGAARTRIAVPWFAFGFIAVAAFNSLQLLPAGVVAVLVQLDTLLLAMAMAALGLGTQASAIRQAGARPLLLALLLFGWLVVGGLAVNLAVQALLR